MAGDAMQIKETCKHVKQCRTGRAYQRPAKPRDMGNAGLRVQEYESGGQPWRSL